MRTNNIFIYLIYHLPYYRQLRTTVGLISRCTVQRSAVAIFRAYSDSEAKTPLLQHNYCGIMAWISLNHSSPSSICRLAISQTCSPLTPLASKLVSFGFFCFLTYPVGSRAYGYGIRVWKDFKHLWGGDPVCSHRVWRTMLIIPIPSELLGDYQFTC